MRAREREGFPKGFLREKDFQWGGIFKKRIFKDSSKNSDFSERMDSSKEKEIF